MLVDNPPTELPIPSGKLSWEIFNDGAVGLGLGVVLAAIGISLLTKYIDKLPVANRLVLPSVAASVEAAVSQESPVRSVRPGDRGEVEMVCRPVGKVRFGQSLVDVTSEGETIEAGCKVRVLRNEGYRAVVEKIEAA